MVEITQLHKEYKFHGQVTITENRHNALIVLKTNLSLQILLPILDSTHFKVSTTSVAGGLTSPKRALSLVPLKGYSRLYFLIRNALHLHGY